MTLVFLTKQREQKRTSHPYLNKYTQQGWGGGTVDRIVLVKFITAYQTIWHSLHAHVKIHVVRIVASWLINTHRWLHAEQETMAVT